MSGALHVLFKVGEAEYGIHASDVLHMESYTGATFVPGAPPYVAGLVQIRRRVVPVIDLRARFGLSERSPQSTLQPRVVVVQVGSRTVGLVADSAREVQVIPADSIRPPPEVLIEQSNGYVRAVAQVKERMVLLVDLGKVVAPPDLPATPSHILEEHTHASE